MGGGASGAGGGGRKGGARSALSILPRTARGQLRGVPVGAADVPEPRRGSDQLTAPPASCLPAAGNPSDLDHRISGGRRNRNGEARGCQLQPFGTITDAQGGRACEGNPATRSRTDGGTCVPDFAAAEPAEA